MNKNTALTIVVILLILLGGLFLLRSDSAKAPTDEIQSGETATTTDNGEEPAVDNGEEPAAVDEDPEPQIHTIAYTDTGFVPAAITARQGDTVIWQNESSSQMWVASAIHPTHTVYPNSNIEKCGTAEEGTFFDQCGAVSVGSAYEFTFDEEGEWGFHNHLQASHTGRVVVE